MNSYNDNLHTNLIVSLQTLEQELKSAEAKKNASMFTLYYAQDATHKASEQLEISMQELENKTNFKTQATVNSNVSNNLLNSANQANSFVKQSITLVAVSAANVQIAANSIVKLASDIGSIYSIVNAADDKSDIYTLAKEALSLINETAKDGELASQIAMEASVLSSEIAASTVVDKAKANNDLMNVFLKIISDDFADVSQTVLAENAALDSIRTVEKLAEGNYLDNAAAYTSAKSAYQVANQVLNLDLKITDESSTGFTICFNRIKKPFKHLQAPAQAGKRYDPIENYYFIIVKDSKKMTFNMSDAENILISDAEEIPEKDNSHLKKSIIPLQDQGSISSPADKGKKQPDILQRVDITERMIGGKGPYTIQDSDGENIKLETSYVVFILAIYTDDYKKKINCFTDFLSAPSYSFTLRNKLVKADSGSITSNKNNDTSAIDITNLTQIPLYDYLHQMPGIQMSNDIVKNNKVSIDELVFEVLDAQDEVDQYQTIVASLTQKRNNFQILLTNAGNNCKQALVNKNLMDQLVQNTKDLQENSATAYNEIVMANAKTKGLAIKLKSLIDKLIYSVDMINTLSTLVIRKKALNPLISDELVSMVGQAGIDANHTVALTLVALQSGFASQAANIESDAAVAVEYAQSRNLYQMMTGTDLTGKNSKVSDEKGRSKKGVKQKHSVSELITGAYENALQLFSQRQTNYDIVTQELNQATIKRNNAQVKLELLQAGLKAGDA